MDSPVSKKEKAFGYFLGPCLMFTVYSAVAGTYLVQYYTDVLGITGIFLTLMPFISKILCGAVSILFGWILDKTHSLHGKARPWILLSGILMAAGGLMLYLLPARNGRFQLVWVVVSYNFFFAIAHNIYSLSHNLMVPLSTRDVAVRDKLAMLTSLATSMLPGMLATVVMPLLVGKIGVGENSRNAWLFIMGLFSVLAIPAALLEFFFTKERVETFSNKSVRFMTQVNSCLRNRFWVAIILFQFLYYLGNTMSNGCMLYYCNWVLGESVESGAGYQVLVNVVGQAPLGIGTALLWPLVNRFGKKKVTVIGFLIAALGSGMLLFCVSNTGFMLVSLLIRSVGILPGYLMAAFLAEAMDDVEQKEKFRADGFTASVSQILQMICAGISQTVLLAGMQKLGYIVPASASQMITQPEPLRNFFCLCFAGLPMVFYLLCSFLILGLKPGKKRSILNAETAE